jgi:hypothetical protein
MGNRRFAVHVLVVASIALVAHGASGGRVAGEVRPDSTRAAKTDDRDAAKPRSRVVYYGRLGVPFMPRDGRLALSGAPLTPRRPDAAPRTPSRPCPAGTAPAAEGRAPELARRTGA